MTADQSEQLCTEILSNVLVQPMLEFLQYLVVYGADPRVRVDKLQKYRELERLNKYAVSEADLALLKELE